MRRMAQKGNVEIKKGIAFAFPFFSSKMIERLVYKLCATLVNFWEISKLEY